MRHLLLNLRPEDVTHCSLAQEIAAYHSHCLSTLTRPQRLQPIYRVSLHQFLRAHPFREALSRHTALACDLLNDMRVVEDEGKDGLDVILWNVFGLVVAALLPRSRVLLLLALWLLFFAALLFLLHFLLLLLFLYFHLYHLFPKDMLVGSPQGRLHLLAPLQPIETVLRLS